MSILSYTKGLSQEEKDVVFNHYSNRALYISILTFEDRHAIGEEIAKEFQATMDYFKELYPGKYQMVVNGPQDREKLLTYNSGWSRYKEKLVGGILDLTTAFVADKKNPMIDVCSAKIRFHDELRSRGKSTELSHSKYFEARIGRKFFDEKQVMQVQEYFIELGLRLMGSLNAMDGIISCEPYGFDTAHEKNMGITGLEKTMLEKHIRSYGWGNFLAPSNVEVLGGIETVISKAPVYRVIPMNNGGAFLQLTESVDDYSDEVLLELKRYLKPLLLGKMREVDIMDFKGQRVILEE